MFRKSKKTSSDVAVAEFGYALERKRSGTDDAPNPSPNILAFAGIKSPRDELRDYLEGTESSNTITPMALMGTKEEPTDYEKFRSPFAMVREDTDSLQRWLEGNKLPREGALPAGFIPLTAGGQSSITGLQRREDAFDEENFRIWLENQHGHGSLSYIRRSIGHLAQKFRHLRVALGLDRHIDGNPFHMEN